VTEYYDRGSLDVILRSSDDIDIPRVLSIAKDIACGMLHLHLENIVHRDLAARNVLVTGDWTCKVSDFGLSRIANKPENTTATKTGPLLWHYLINFII
jgi:serine/threonine protein kinase